MIKRQQIIFFSALCLFFFIVLPWLIGYLVTIFPNVGTFGDSSDWFNFWQNYLGALIGVVVVFIIFYLERQHEQKKEKQKRLTDIYENFILKYYYPISFFVDYLIVPYGGNRRFNQEQIHEATASVIRNMLEDFKYASPTLKQKLKDWEYFDYFSDLKGDQKQIVQVEIARELFFQTFENSKKTGIMDFRDNYWIFFTVLIFYRYISKGTPLCYKDWMSQSLQLYCDILNKYPDSHSQKQFCLKVYAANYSKIDDSSELNKLWESLKSNT